MIIKRGKLSLICAAAFLSVSACTEDIPNESESTVQYYLFEDEPGPLFWEGEKQTDLGNLEKARVLFLESCKAGTGGSCAVLGIMFVNGEGGEVDNKQGCRYFRKSCAMGYAQACTGMASFLEGDMCGASNPHESERLYRIACETGHVDGCIGLGDFYKNGLGGKVDLDAARKLYSEACIAEERVDCVQYVGRMLEGSGGE